MGASRENLPEDAELVLVDDALFDAHRAPGYHPERPARLESARRAVEGLRNAGLHTRRLLSRDATDEELAKVHTRTYLEELASLAGQSGALDEDTFLSAGSVAAARRGAGGGLALVDALLASDAKRTRGLSLVRPPGHHATPGRGMGFCLINHVAVAAAHALAAGLDRVAIVDWDVHHGNGTEDAFYEDGRVLFVSIHQWPVYPGSGRAENTGRGAGEGTNVNIPLSRGATDAVYDRVFERIVEPVLEGFAPELILVSAGFDAHMRDPLAEMALSREAYRSMAARLAHIAERTAQGRLGLFLEGGYDLGALEESLIATLEGLWPGERERTSTTGLELPSHDAEIERVRQIVGRSHDV